MTGTTQTTEETRAVNGFPLPEWLAGIAHLVIVAALPLLLVLLNARVFMSNIYLRWEYNRRNFPEDPYGFTTEERLEYGSQGLAYLFNNEGPEFLSGLTFADGSPLFNAREVSHMQDVKNVTRRLSRFGYGLIAGYLTCVVLLAVKPGTRPLLFSGLLVGSMLTVALIVLGLVVTATSFNWLFTQFHGLFFEGNTWIFPHSDTLIRLYPEQFWIDAFALVFGGALLQALILAVIMWRLTR